MPLARQRIEGQAYYMKPSVLSTDKQETDSLNSQILSKPTY